MGVKALMKESRDIYVHQLSTTMEYPERVWHEKRELEAVSSSNNQYDCQHGQGITHPYGNLASYL